MSSSLGNASSFLYGIQAKKVSFFGPCAELSGPQSATPGLFSKEPASFLQVLWQVLLAVEHDDDRLVQGGRGRPRLTISSSRS